MKKALLLFSILLIGIWSFAHEFWLEPVKFLLKVNELVTINIVRGEGFLGERSDGTKYKIQLLRHFSAQGEEDYHNKIGGADSSTIKAAFNTEGNHLIAFNNTSKFLVLESAKFNSYLLEEGLTNAYEIRLKNNDTAKSGRELYQRCVKTLFQVGSKQDDSYAINTGMRLELMPAQNPYAAKDGEQLSFRVLFDNQPLKNALVLVWQDVNKKVTMVKYKSNEAGEVSFPFAKKGKWMISTVRMVPHTNTTEADWQSYWGSYTFGFQ
jgi:uncharacterized GH25 family protein